MFESISGIPLLLPPIVCLDIYAFPFHPFTLCRASCCVLNEIFLTSRCILVNDIAFGHLRQLVSFSDVCNEAQCQVTSEVNQRASQSPSDDNLYAIHVYTSDIFS